MSVIDISSLVTSLWDAVKEQIPEKRQEDIATAMIEALLRNDVIENVNELDAVIGVDPTLDGAIALILEEQADIGDIGDQFEDEYDVYSDEE